MVIDLRNSNKSRFTKIIPNQYYFDQSKSCLIPGHQQITNSNHNCDEPIDACESLI